MLFNCNYLLLPYEKADSSKNLSRLTKIFLHIKNKNEYFCAKKHQNEYFWATSQKISRHPGNG